MRPQTMSGGVVLETRGELLAVTLAHQRLLKCYGADASALLDALNCYSDQLPDDTDFTTYAEPIGIELTETEGRLACMSLKYVIFSTDDIGECLRSAEVVEDYCSKGGKVDIW